MDKTTLPLRPHHGLCLRFFRGKGYSDNFVAGMKKIHSALHGEPFREITLVCHADNICEACPNMENNVCNTEHKVSEFDLKVLELCGISENDILTWEDFSDLISENILNKNLLPQVCGSCRWFYICKNLQFLYTERR